MDWLKRTDTVELRTLDNGDKFEVIDGLVYTKIGYLKDNPNLAVVVDGPTGKTDYFCPSALVVRI